MNSKWIGYILIGLILLVEVPRFAGAYNAVDGTLLTAIGTGIALPVGAGYVFHAWWKAPDTRKGRNVLLVWFGTLLALESITLVPWDVAQLRAQPLAVVLTPGIDWAWIAVVMVSPFAMTAAVVNGLAFQKENRAKSGTEPAKAKMEARPVTFICTSPGCTYHGASQAALNGHMKAHRNGHERIVIVQEAQG